MSSSQFPSSVEAPPALNRSPSATQNRFVNEPTGFFPSKIFSFPLLFSCRDRASQQNSLRPPTLCVFLPCRAMVFPFQALLLLDRYPLAAVSTRGNFFFSLLERSYASAFLPFLDFITPFFQAQRFRFYSSPSLLNTRPRLFFASLSSLGTFHPPLNPCFDRGFPFESSADSAAAAQGRGYPTLLLFERLNLQRLHFLSAFCSRSALSSRRRVPFCVSFFPRAGSSFDHSQPNR